VTVCRSVWRLLSRALGAAPKPSSAQVEAVVTALSCATTAYVPILVRDELRAFTEDELGQRWRESGEELLEDPSRLHRPDLITERQHLLEEIVRRHPAAFSAWLTSDAPTASLPHLTGSRTGRRSIDWDALLQRKD
jgi:hypothetical protein